MSSYIVTYDLSAPNRDYPKLYEYFQQYAYAKVTESTWIIQTWKTAAAVRDEIADIVDSDDKVLVIQTTRNAAWIGLSGQIGDWLKNHLVSAA